tara:strand:+ start:388 stop:963 length:576 start_codon:yes stop_codon:yes gene_type:complete
MIKIGIVGDIGSGKSYVARQFKSPVFSADAEVTKLYKKNKKCFFKLKKALPSFVTSFPINKNSLNAAIIADKKNLKKINKIVHPEIKIKMNNFVKRNRKKKIVVLDIPLLMENKINKNNDILIFVDANKKEIYKRLKKRPRFNLKIVRKLKKLQLPIETKKRKSDFIIKNNFKNKSIKKSVKIIKKILLND